MMIYTNKKYAAAFISGLILLALAIGSACSNSPSNNATNGKSANNTANNANTPQAPVNVPAGASPPNQSGSPTAAVTVEEFADFQCPQCAHTHPMVSEIKSMYGSRIHFIFRNYPLPMHDKSYEAAVAAEAAGLQNPNKFWEMQNLLFSNQKAWADSNSYKDLWKGYAEKIGLDVNKWENDMAGIQAKGRVDADLARAKAMNINGTPSFYINGTSVAFADINVEGLKKLIDAELEKSSAQKPVAANSGAPSAPANK
jgi:protein-disulfide isomerase